MPEGRMLSKSIATSEQVASVSLLADYLFTRMIPHLDSEGRMAGSPRTVRGIVCPLREDVTSDQVAGALAELHAIGLIVWYAAAGQQVVAFPKFRDHQRGARFDRESPSRLPAPATTTADNSADMANNSGVGPEDAGSPPVVLPLSEGKGSEVKSSEELPPPQAREELSQPALSDVETQLRDQTGEHYPELARWLGARPADKREDWAKDLLKLIGPATGNLPEDLARACRDGHLATPPVTNAGTLRHFVRSCRGERLAGDRSLGKGPSPAEARAAVLLDLFRRHDLLAYGGDSAAYELKVYAASQDPLAGPHFRAEVDAVQPWKGIDAPSDFLKVREIAARLGRRAA